jgi:hypothetical protein
MLLIFNWLQCINYRILVTEPYNRFHIKNKTLFINVLSELFFHNMFSILSLYLKNKCFLRNTNVNTLHGWRWLPTVCTYVFEYSYFRFKYRFLTEKIWQKRYWWELKKKKKKCNVHDMSFNTDGIEVQLVKNYSTFCRYV